MERDLKFTTAGEYMNDRIRTAMDRAGVHDNPDREGIELFARLIVSDCAGIIYNNCDDDAEGERIGKMLLEAYGIGE